MYAYALGDIWYGGGILVANSSSGTCLVLSAAGGPHTDVAN